MEVERFQMPRPDQVRGTVHLQTSVRTCSFADRRKRRALFKARLKYELRLFELSLHFGLHLITQAEFQESLKAAMLELVDSYI